MKLSSFQVAGLWISEGGNPSKAAEAAAVVECESGGDTKVRSSVGARGMWQFMPGTLPDEACALDPRCSTREAIKLSKNGTDFSAWDCHPDAVGRTGSSKGLGGGIDVAGATREIRSEIGSGKTKAVGLWEDLFSPGLGPSQGTPFGPKTGDVPGVGEALESADEVANAINSIGRTLEEMARLLFTPQGWLQIGKLLGGAMLIIFAVYMFSKRALSPGVRRAGKRAASKATKGKQSSSESGSENDEG